MTEFVTTAKRSNWSARFSPDVCKLWRTLQTELTHRGATDRAKELEEHIRCLLGIVYGCDLPEKKLHFTAQPTLSKRTDLLSLLDAKQGMPQRQIAKTVGVERTQVRRGLGQKAPSNGAKGHAPAHIEQKKE